MSDETQTLPAWHAAHAMDMIDTFRNLGCRIGHGVTEDPEIVLGPVFLPGGKTLFCSMTLYDTGWSYYFKFADFGLSNLRGSDVWELPEELVTNVITVLAAITMEKEKGG